MALKTLVSTADLEARLTLWRVFDCRHDLMKPELGAQQYAQSHIPGALFASVDQDLSDLKDGTHGRHPLPDRGAFIAWLGQQGLHASDQVVCYDGGSNTYAARMWWMLRAIGHEAVAVLDGGFAKWVKEGRAVSTQIPRFAHAPYKVLRSHDAYVDADFLAENLGKLQPVDARAAARFRGEQEPIDPVAGRIPGAKNRNCADNLGADGTLKDKETLRREFSALLGDRKPSEVVHYCGSGVSACSNLLAMEVAGLSGARLYPGSWSEWIVDPKRPRAKGE
jgi:thiosulfate/3-mercaptopyruvate sulfurtransferase